MIIPKKTPVLGFAAYSGTGKTSLLVKLIPCLRARGLRVGMIKHAHHDFDIDHPGKDSYELRQAGATQMLIGAPGRWALISERTEPQPLQLQDYIAKLDHEQLDLILVEGFKPEKINKIELYRPSLGKPLLFPDDDSIIAIATDAVIDDTKIQQAANIPVLDLNNIDQICKFVLQQMLTVKS